MKFAKELEQDLVPEWRIKYLNYKAGKKYIKAVSRAINRAHGTPSIGRRAELPPHTTPSFFSPNNTFTSSRRSQNSQLDGPEEIDPLRASPAPMGQGKAGARRRDPPPTRSMPVPGERQGLARSPGSEMRYGSIIPTPPDQAPSPLAQALTRDDNEFALPAPALKVPTKPTEPERRPPTVVRSSLSRLALQRSASMVPTIGGQPTSLGPSSGGMTPRQRLQRIFSTGSPLARRSSKVEMLNLDDVREREREFFGFLDDELEKVEGFYKLKEEQAGKRLQILRDQLHEMRNRRVEEISEARRRREHSTHGDSKSGAHDQEAGNQHHSLLDPLRAKLFKPGPNSKALQKMARTPVMAAGPSGDDGRDYVRRPHDHDVPYRTAKRKLKLALQEFYRGLELLKSYALLNRTAFRKLNKKYDKAVNARPPYRYMNEKVNKAWFVNSDVLDGHITAVEDLYARYFERGNHKLAVGKLRELTKRPGDRSVNAFQNGLFIGIGSVFTIQGLVYGAQLIFSDDPVLQKQTTYLMQIYGGYFLMLLLFGLFCLDCCIWNARKVNYPFIFEFDPRNNLDWRQVVEFPSFFLCLFGFFFWLNFTRLGPQEMYLYYPIILIFVTLVILFLPLPIFWHKSRRWFLYSHWRLFFAGLYPVEFRDFFLGDIYCSLTYATANIELFFCLYAQAWDNADQCNSSHSRAMGFLAALPGVWRALQCIRRYYDTRNVFPHLVNCGKYMMTIMAAVTLSLYRIDGTNLNLSLFVLFSIINGIYCSIWDILMDFSLLQPNSRHFLLRDILAIKKHWYYVIMVMDPMLRFSWIFYAIFTHDAQHNSIVSFLVAFAEVFRRGMWTLFRVENEHSANVAQYKASRDIPLPYHLEPLVTRASLDSAIEESPTTPRPAPAAASSGASAHSTGVEVPGSGRVRPQDTPPAPPASDGRLEEGGGLAVRRRRADTLGKRSLTRIIAEAHKQDFEKKRKPTEEIRNGVADEEDDDDDEDDGMHSADEDDSDLDARMEVQAAEGLLRRGHGDADDDFN